MNNSNRIVKLTPNLKIEAEILRELKFNTWEKLSEISDTEISNITTSSLASKRNLEKIRCMAILICELDIPESEAALLMHSGISSLQAIKKLTPEELYKRTSRLERILKTGRIPIFNLEKANKLIKKAKNNERNH